MKQGAYRLNATYLGSNAYYSSYNLNYMNVTRLNARMVSDAVYVTIGKTAKITVTILDETNHHAENGTVTFTLNGTTIGKATVKKENVKEGLQISLPMIPHLLSQIFLSSCDLLMIKSISGESSAGIYSVAYTIANILYTISLQIFKPWSPWVYRRIENKETDSIKENSKLIMHIVLHLRRRRPRRALLSSPLQVRLSVMPLLPPQDSSRGAFSAIC